MKEEERILDRFILDEKNVNNEVKLASNNRKEGNEKGRKEMRKEGNERKEGRKEGSI